ncbi:MAG: hypothetical protein U0Y82_11870 [Thermoleophilia bacterium]
MRGIIISTLILVGAIGSSAFAVLAGLRTIFGIDAPRPLIVGTGAIAIAWSGVLVLAWTRQRLRERGAGGAEG